MIKKSMKGLLVLGLSVSLLVGCNKADVEAPKELVETRLEDRSLGEDYSFKFNDDGTVIDSAGRLVELPDTIGRIVPAGNPAQMVLYSLVPEKIVGWANAPKSDALKYMEAGYRDLPEIGAFYGKNASMNMEELIKVGPDLLLDIGEVKPGIKEDMDKIAEQTEIPTIFIEATLDSLPDMYRTLGKLFDKEEDCSLKARYIEESIEEAREKARQIKEEDRVKVYYGSGDSGLQSNSESSIHNDILKLIGADLVFKDQDQNARSWEEISLEQVILWNPELIFFTPDSKFDQIYEDQAWAEIEAVKNKKVYEVPGKPYNWLGRPPMINRILGIKWAGQLLYPDIYDYDLVKEAQEFYKMFYSYELGEEEAKDLMSNSIFMD